MTMSATATPRPAPPSSTGQPPSALGPLLGLYALVFLVLGCIGAFAGEVFFLGDRALSAGHNRTIAQCLRASVMHSQSAIPAFDRCVSGTFRLEGLFVAAVAVAVPSLAALVSLITPRVTQQRLARSAGFNVPDAAASFEALCDEAQLTGRRRPQLLVAGIEQQEAYTTGLPGRRPLIVIPPKTAVAVRDPNHFDPVVLHEIAHVRARDVSWVSSVRHITWITLPVVALACIPQIFDADGGQFSGTVVLQAAVFVAGTALVARELLRRREIEADRQAVRWLRSPDQLFRLLEVGRRAVHAKTGRAGEWWSRPLARHPSPAVRIAALQDPLGKQDGGFVYALVAGVVTVIAMNTSYFLTWALDEVDGGWLPARVSAVVAAIVLGFSLTPALVRRATRARRTGTSVAWWQPVAGTTLGMLLGALIPPGTTPGATASILAGIDLRRALITLFIAGAGAGLATLTAGLASLAADGRPHRWPSLRTAWLTAAVCGCSAAALWPIPGFTTGQTWRLWVTDILPSDQWHWLVIPYLGTALLLTARDWRRSGRARDAAVLLITPVCAAVVGATLFLARVHLTAITPYDMVVRVTEERWWACALSGWVILVILALAGGVRGLARACLSAWLAAVLTGLVLIVHGTPAVYGTFEPLSSAITVSSVLLFYLAVPTACLALLGDRQPGAVRRTWPAPVGASVAAAVTVALALSAALAGAIAPLPPQNPPLRPPSPPGPLATQALTQSQAKDVAAAAESYLGSTWIPGSFPAPAPAHVTYQPTNCAALAHEDYLNALPRPLARAENRYKAAPALSDDGLETLSVRVESFSRTVPASLLTEASRIFRACPQYTTQTSGSPVAGSNGSSFVTTHAVTKTGPHGAIWRADISMDLEPGSASITWIMITAGHNFLLISQQTISPGSGSQPDEKVISAAVNATVTALDRAVGSQYRFPVSGTTSASQVASPSQTPTTNDESAILSGTWTGAYYCNQGETGLRLIMQASSDGQVNATFNFYPLPGNPDVPSGSFVMTGSYSADGVVLTPDHWISEPPGYEMVGLAGVLESGNQNVLEGQITTSRCTAFSVQKS
jgi:Zn-dependent protease with chaperone function